MRAIYYLPSLATDQAAARRVSEGDRETAVGAAERLLGRVLRKCKENIHGLCGYRNGKSSKVPGEPLAKCVIAFPYDCMTPPPLPAVCP